MAAGDLLSALSTSWNATTRTIPGHEAVLKGTVDFLIVPGVEMLERGSFFFPSSISFLSEGIIQPHNFYLLCNYVDFFPSILKD